MLPAIFRQCTHSVVTCLILIFTQTAFWLFNRVEWFGFVAFGVQCLILCCCYECLCFNLGSFDFFHLSSICRHSLLMCFKVLPVCTVRVAACWHKYSQSHLATSFVIQYLVIASCFQAAYIRDLSRLLYCVLLQSCRAYVLLKWPGWFEISLLPVFLRIFIQLKMETLETMPLFFLQASQYSRPSSSSSFEGKRISMLETLNLPVSISN